MTSCFKTIGGTGRMDGWTVGCNAQRSPPGRVTLSNPFQYTSRVNWRYVIDRQISHVIKRFTYLLTYLLTKTKHFRWWNLFKDTCKTGRWDHFGLRL